MKLIYVHLYIWAVPVSQVARWVFGPILIGQAKPGTLSKVGLNLRRGGAAMEYA